MKNLWHKIKWFFQRLIRGYDDPSWWDLDFYLAEWILPRLRHLRKHVCGCPAEMSELEWDNILARMVLAFSMIAEFGGDREDNEAIQKQMDDGLDLFRKYYFCLWD